MYCHISIVTFDVVSLYASNLHNLGIAAIN